MDSDGIKDYSFFAFIGNSQRRFSYGSTSNSTSEFRFPVNLNEITSYQLRIQIRDVYNSITELNLSSILIISNASLSIDFLEQFNPSVENLVQQIFTFSTIFNDFSKENLRQLIENSI